MAERTIAAIASPMGVGGIGVIRISGEDAISVADRCFCAVSGRPLKSYEGYRAAYGTVKTKDGCEIDDAVALVFRAPKSYTGEDVVELSVHGGTAILKDALRAVLSCGAVLAGAGEFTKRAFLNGKIALSKAESIMELISAKNEAALRVARGAKNGNIDKAVNEITDRLVETAANISVFADYPDEDIPALSEENFGNLLSDCIAKLQSLLSTYDSGKAVREGINCCIAGKPNVGKSTLMNLLSGYERSIVTDIEGTTRDVVETVVNIGDLTLNLSDTAGIRETTDAVEKIGVERALASLDSSALILAVFDASRGLDKNDLILINAIKDKRAVAVINKSDLESKIDTSVFGEMNVCFISAKTGSGKEELKEKIESACRLLHLTENDAVLINERQRECACRALDSVSAAKEALLSGVTVDAVGVCVDEALSALFELNGKRVTSEVTDDIFRRFCVGK